MGFTSGRHKYSDSKGADIYKFVGLTVKNESSCLLASVCPATRRLRGQLQVKDEGLSSSVKGCTNKPYLYSARMIQVTILVNHTAVGLITSLFFSLYNSDFFF